MSDKIPSPASISRSIAQKAVDVLNEAFKADPITVTELVLNRLECNRELAEHPEISCMEKNGKVVVGMLGFIVGIVERQSGIRICAIFKDQSTCELIGFGIVEDVVKGPQTAIKVEKL